MNYPPINYKEFYLNYQTDYWGYKIAMLKNSLDNFKVAKNTIYSGLEDTNDDDCLLMIKTEIHFLYFQIIETLFELIFALEERAEEYLWYSLSFPTANNYNKIKDIAKGDKKLFKKKWKIKVNQSNEIHEIEFLDYVFYHYFHFPEKHNNKNLDSIARFLEYFAQDFSDRYEYNAFKHALRILYCKPGVRIESCDNKFSADFQSKDGFKYLERDIKNKEKISLTAKAFNTDRDVKMSSTCAQLISNIISSRKMYYFKTIEELYYFDNVDFDEVIKNTPGPLGKMKMSFKPIYSNNIEIKE